MIVMAKLSNIVVRNGTYHFRMVIPLDLRAHYRKREHSLSLKTKDPLEAQKKANALTEKYKKEHSGLRAQNVEQVSDGNHLQKRSVSKSALAWIEDEFNSLSAELDGMENDALRTLKVHVHNAEHSIRYAVDKGLTVESIARVDLNPVLNQTLLGICQKIAGTDDLSDGVLRRKTARSVIPKLLAMLKNLRNKIPPLLGEPVEPDTILQIGSDGRWRDVVPPTPIDPPTVTAAINNGPKLSEVLNECLGAKKRSAATEKRLRSSVQLLIDWFGDVSISIYTRKMMIDFIDNCLMKIPPNRNKNPKWRSLTLHQILDSKPEQVIEVQTMHNNLADITTVFAYAVENGMIEKNPAVKLAKKLPEIQEVDRSYSIEEIERMLKNLAYNEKFPSRYWVPLIGLYSGARLNEICQLHLSDIRMINDVWCFHFGASVGDETRKRIKNKASIRTVPVHPALINIGFLKYYADRQKAVKPGNQLLFRELTYKALSGYSEKMSEWFNNYLKPKFVDSDNSTENGFHSLRNTFAKQAQNQAQMEDRPRMEILGHKPTATSKIDKQYTQGLLADRLAKEMAKLDYGLPLPGNPYYKTATD